MTDFIFEKILPPVIVALLLFALFLCGKLAWQEIRGVAADTICITVKGN